MDAMDASNGAEGIIDKHPAAKVPPLAAGFACLQTVGQ